MVTKKKCTFCGEEIVPGTGKMVVDASGSISFYCSSKCEKNTGLKRSARKVKWTKEYRREKAIRVQHLKESGSKEKAKKEEPKKAGSKESKPKKKSKKK
jgi:large subunit ribosomal protein L24e